MNWFEIRQLDKRTYIISENKHYEKTNIYYLIGEQFNVCIDSGMGLYKLGNLLEMIDNKKRCVITTHAHWDHIGNHDEFDIVYFHKKAQTLLKTGELTPLDMIKTEMVRGISEEDIPNNFEVEKYQLYDGEGGTVIEDGDIIDLGNRKLEIIHTPGHTPDSISILDKTTGYLFVGDFIYKGALYCGASNNNPKEYLTSLEKLIQRKAEISSVFSGHYEVHFGKEYLNKVYKIFNQAEKEGKLIKGVGKYCYEGIEIIL
ncbi:MBL fold metallo-hydrolase [Alkaliphilus transvaalensis]|uniref:MBL fold metallo-hydrolase n=1 Tax=Alkaliphilus transvaalensis TaxID=114628 RepID=UPI0004786812|nr:MBL fold metallo-hydrolase [Alkaliphilus transvaalensis]